LNQPRHCPAVLIAAPASGQGKTTVTAALARLHRNLGRKVRVFKCGPDFLDPMIHERASGAPVYQLDMWMVGEQESRRLLWEAAGGALRSPLHGYTFPNPCTSVTCAACLPVWGSAAA